MLEIHAWSSCLECMVGAHAWTPCLVIMFLGRVKSRVKEATTIMYLPAHFTETDAQSNTGLIAEFPLAKLVAGIDDGVAAHHLPLLLLGGDRLIGHVALAIDLHHQLEDGAPMIVIFRGESS